MHSKPLRQAVDLALDTMGMQGPVTRRQVAQRVIEMTTDQDWALGDQVEARIAYLQQEIASRMSAPHSPHIVQQYATRIPPAYRNLFDKLPRFICISPRGGREAQHVMALNATADDWAANMRLKERITEATAISTDVSRSIHDLLRATRSTSLADLLPPAEAAE